MLRATLFGDCPNCLFGSQFDGPLRARRRCALCGMGFEPNDDGSSALGAAYLVLTVVPILLIAEGVLLARAYGLFSGFGIVMALSAVLLIALSYRPARGWWVWCQWTFGFLDATRDLELRAGASGRRGAESR